MDTNKSKAKTLALGLAKKMRKEIKKPEWNVPESIYLSLSRETTVGRCASESTGTASVVLNSPKLPAMLSRKHASLKYDPKTKGWMVEDLEVYMLVGLGTHVT